MQKMRFVRVFDSVVGNRKSAIQNSKLVGIVALITFAMCGVEVPAQQPKKFARIGYLSGTDPASDSARSDAIRLALRSLGYTEGQNIATEYRYAEGKVERLPQLAAELVRLNVNLIVAAGGTTAILAA